LADLPRVRSLVTVALVHLLIVIVMLLLAFGMVSWFPLRCWFLNWDARREEMARVMPGDSRICIDRHRMWRPATCAVA
jgi:cytochrome c oxidase assembly protein Cox11